MSLFYRIFPKNLNLMNQDQSIQITVFIGHNESQHSDFNLYQKNIQNEAHHPFGTDKKTEHVPLALQVIGQVDPLPITNSLFSILVTLFLASFAVILSRSISRIPGKIQAVIEITMEKCSQNIAIERKAMRNELRKELVNLIILGVGKVAGQVLVESDQKNLCPNEPLAKLSSLTW